MKRAGLWLCAASTLALAACHRPTQPVAAKPVATANAPAAPAPAALKIDASSPATPATPAVGESSGAAKGSSAAAPGGRSRRHGVPKRHDARRLLVHDRGGHDRGGHDRPIHGRASGGGHSATAGTNGPGSPAPVARRASAAYKACIASAHGFTVALGECYSAELARQGARVNRLYVQALAARQDARLEQSQSDWARERDAECQASSTAAIDIQREGACRIDMTARRADELERLVSSDERRGRG